MKVIANTTQTRSIKVSKDMKGWINEFNNLAVLITSTYHDEELRVGYKVRSVVMDDLCVRLEKVLHDLTDEKFYVCWDQSSLTNVLDIELRK